jgi:hypothetical protein
LTAILLACGGGGGGSGSQATSSTISVTPALGGVSEGVAVSIFDAQTGTLLGSGTTSIVNGLGTASITVPTTFKGIAVVRVNGCAACTYLDERTFQPVAFGATDSLLAVLPSTDSTTERSVGVSALTSMAAAKVGVTSTNFSGTTYTPPTTAISDTSLNAAVSTVLDIFGVAGTDASNKDLMFSKPVVFGLGYRAGDKLSGTGTSLNLGVLLTALAQSTPTGTSLISQSNNLSTVLHQSYQGQVSNVKTAISTANLISDFSTKLASVTQNNVASGSTVDASFTAKLNTASSAIKSSGISVVPALGAFTAGARVEAYDPVTGLAIGEGGTTDDTGIARITLGSHATSFILKVSGSGTAKYFEEGLGSSGTSSDFTSNDVLLALVPASAAVTPGSAIAVTPLTHMAAGLAVNSLSDLKVNVPSGKDAADVMYEALARVRYMTGLAVQGSERGKITLNPLLAPSLLSASNKAIGINLSEAGGYYGLFLAELSKAVSTEVPARSSLDLAKSLFNHAASIKALVAAGSLRSNSLAVSNFQASTDYAAITTANAAVGAGNSIFINACKSLPQQDLLSFNSVYANANTLTNFAPTANELAQMVLDLTFAADTKITKNLVSPFTQRNTGASGCL